MVRLESLKVVQILLNQQCTSHQLYFFTSHRFTMLPAYIEEKGDRAPSGGPLEQEPFLACPPHVILIKVLPLIHPLPPSFFLSISVPLSYLLTPWSRVLLKKLTVSHLVKKFPTFYGTCRFISRITSARPPPVPIPSQINPVHVPPSQFLMIYLNIILLFPLSYIIKILRAL